MEKGKITRRHVNRRKASKVKIFEDFVFSREDDIDVTE
jgi:hypothetical protein